MKYLIKAAIHQHVNVKLKDYVRRVYDLREFKFLRRNLLKGERASFKLDEL